MRGRIPVVFYRDNIRYKCMSQRILQTAAHTDVGSALSLRFIEFVGRKVTRIARCARTEPRIVTCQQCALARYLN